MAASDEKEKQEWLQHKNDLFEIQQNLDSAWDHLEEEDKEEADELKTGLRLSTYVEALTKLRVYPTNIAEANEKAKEIVKLFTEMGNSFEQEGLNRIRMLIEELENLMKPCSALDYLQAVGVNDPAGEDDDEWAIELFD